MKKKTFFLSSLVAVALFVGALSFSSCNKEDVDYDSVNTPAYVVTPDNPKSGESYNCPWCGATIAPGESCKHYYGMFQLAAGHPDSVYCNDPTCPCYDATHANNPIKHFHIFDVCDWGHASHFHVGGGSSSYNGHTHITN